ncbi:hypothetical protein EHO61_06335 [Leptospira fluminis]|uniref:Uncharacterized protein n=1 Tax=Leptospira fluminis TaxID=2484979 RepID=A0A4R9GR49_9LEPT|nr:tetratricopeptide repeat protein [Leptospira fluminis]TGK20117.1 hypothetical protein EHO61_06335 [Leptospira fluminis]
MQILKQSRFASFLLFVLVAWGCGGVSKDTKDRYAAGVAFYDAKNLKEAIVQFQNVYSEDPNYLSTRFMLGKCYFYSKNFQKAKEFFGEDYDSNRNRLHSGIWWYRTRFLLGEDPKEILSGVVSLLEVDPELSEGWILRGMIEEKLGKPSEALQSYLKAAEESDRIALVNFRLSKVFRKIGLSERADAYEVKARALGYKEK